MTKEKEDLSLGKFLSGFFSVKNIAKAIVLGILFMCVQYVSVSVWKRIQPQLSHVIDSTMGDNSGSIANNDSHDAHETNCGPLSVIFGSCGGQT